MPSPFVKLIRMGFCQSQKAILILFLLVASAFISARADPASVTLAWDASPGPGIAGYRLYEGDSSGTYTNIIDVGNGTVATVSNLVTGATYYFAVSAYDEVGLESVLSAEISYTVTPPMARLQLAISPEMFPILTGSGPVGYSYDLLTSSDLQTWLRLTNLTINSNGFCSLVVSNRVTTTDQNHFYRLQQTAP